MNRSTLSHAVPSVLSLALLILTGCTTSAPPRPIIPANAFTETSQLQQECATVVFHNLLIEGARTVDRLEWGPFTNNSLRISPGRFVYQVRYDSPYSRGNNPLIGSFIADKGATYALLGAVTNGKWGCSIYVIDHLDTNTTLDTMSLGAKLNTQTLHIPDGSKDIIDLGQTKEIATPSCVTTRVAVSGAARTVYARNMHDASMIASQFSNITNSAVSAGGNSALADFMNDMNYISDLQECLARVYGNQTDDYLRYLAMNLQHTILLSPPPLGLGRHECKLVSRNENDPEMFFGVVRRTPFASTVIYYKCGDRSEMFESQSRS